MEPMHEVQWQAISYTSRRHLVFTVLSTSLPSNVIEMINATSEPNKWRYHDQPSISYNRSGRFVSQKWRSL